MILAFELLERSKGVSADEGDSHVGPWCSLSSALGNKVSFCFAFNIFFSLPNTQASYELEVITVVLWM